MGIRFQGGWAEGLARQTARAMGGALVPSLVILHDTASRLAPGNAAAYLAGAAKVSVHFVAERDGSVVQQVPVDRVAFHAGQSSFQGRKGCNAFALGIEVVNPGRLTDLGRGRGQSWFKQVFTDGEEAGTNLLPTPPECLASHGPGVWMDYTEAQIEGVMALLAALFRDVATLEDIATHWYVSPGRKVDTNPFFPLEPIRARILGRDDPADLAAEAGSDEAGDVWARVTTSGGALNMRRWPSFNPNVLGEIPNGALVPVLRFGSFGGQLWNLVRWNGIEGWVVDRYTTTEARTRP